MKKLFLSIVCLLALNSLQTFAQCGAGFQWYPNTINPPVANFADSSYGAGTLSYQWDFGDGTFDTGQNPVHTYAVNANYNVCLTITDSLGCVSTSCDSVTFTSPPPTVSSYLILDSMSFFNCTAPQYISFYYYASASGYLTTDSLKFEINYGDGIDSIFYLSLATTGFQGVFTHQYLNAGNYTAQLIVTGPNLQSSTSPAQTLIIASSCGNISGTVYNDLNGNCTYDAGEEIPNISLEISNAGQFMGWTNSDANGVYSFNVPTGATYDVHVVANGGFNGQMAPSCPLSGIITVSSVPSTGNDFGIVCPQGFDLQGTVSGWGFRPGSIGSVCVYVYNQRCNSPASGQIDVTFPADLTPLPDSMGTSYTINGQTVTYPINSSQLSWSFCIPVGVSTSAQLGDSVCIDLNIQPIVGDSVPSNNTGTFCFVVRNSYDPNDKYVNPKGDGPQGLVRPNTTLTYTIRFQNTGNADAINIYILDTLDANLDESSVEIIGTSHNVNMSLLTGNILRFNYDNIMLADSNSNEPASHGYVTYRINQKNNLAQLSTIRNTASIYFDFNQPIITNTTINTVDNTLSVLGIEKQKSLVNAYPNPANGKCHLYFNNTHQKIISVSDVMGKEVLRHSTTADSYQMNTEKFAEGIYTIHISDNGISSDTFKLIVNH